MRLDVCIGPFLFGDIFSLAWFLVIRRGEICEPEEGPRVLAERVENGLINYPQ